MIFCVIPDYTYENLHCIFAGRVKLGKQLFFHFVPVNYFETNLYHNNCFDNPVLAGHYLYSVILVAEYGLIKGRTDKA